MVYTFTIIFLAIILFKLSLMYFNFTQTEKNFQKFCNKWNVLIAHNFKIWNLQIPELHLQFSENRKCKISWVKQGKGRNFNHILKVYFEFNYPIIDFQVASKNIIPKLNTKENWIEVEKNLFCNRKELKNHKFLWNEIQKIQTDYGWGILEIKDNQAFYTIIAEPSQNQAWEHLHAVINLLANYIRYYLPNNQT